MPGINFLCFGLNCWKKVCIDSNSAQTADLLGTLNLPVCDCSLTHVQMRMRTRRHKHARFEIRKMQMRYTSRSCTNKLYDARAGVLVSAARLRLNDTERRTSKETSTAHASAVAHAAAAAAQYKYTHATNILLCIVCGVFSIQYGGPARYMFFFLGSVLFWGDAASAPPSLSRRD